MDIYECAIYFFFPHFLTLYKGTVNMIACRPLTYILIDIYLSCI